MERSHETVAFKKGFFLNYQLSYNVSKPSFSPRQPLYVTRTNCQNIVFSEVDKNSTMAFHWKHSKDTGSYNMHRSPGTQANRVAIVANVKNLKKRSV